MNVRDKVLIVEDDEGIRKFLSTTLIANGYSVILADDGTSALELVPSHCPVCILLDLGLPDIDGNEIIRSIRSWTSIPILVISARTTEDDKAGALDLGADDYLTKPFSTVELLARIRTALRHARTPAGNDELSLTGSYHVGELTVDMRKHRVFLAGRDVGLTPNEFRIVSLLAAHAGQVLTYKYILRAVSYTHLRCVRLRRRAPHLEGRRRCSPSVCHHAGRQRRHRPFLRLVYRRGRRPGQPAHAHQKRQL